MKRILVINGANLIMLGKREPDIYGNQTYDDLVEYIKAEETENLKIDCFVSNHEGEIIDIIHKANDDCDGVIINPGAHTHYSYAIADAIKAIKTPVIEVHLSDINNREDFRKISVTAAGCIKQISGYGFDSYKKAIEYFKDDL